MPRFLPINDGMKFSFSSQILIAVNKFVQLCEFKVRDKSKIFTIHKNSIPFQSLQVPSDFLNKFISLCISICERDSSQDMAADRLG